MTWQYTPHDVALRNAVRMELQVGGTGSDGSKSDGNIEFQFPPKVTSDSRKGNWKEVDKPGTEPTFAYKTSSAREITIQWTYVVDSFESNANAWSIGRITKNIRTLRGYFAQIRSPKADHDKLVVVYKQWSMGGTGGGQETMSALFKSIDVKYGDAIICQPGDIDQSFFLRTDITVDLRLWTKGKGEGSVDVLQDIKKIQETLEPEWY